MTSSELQALVTEAIERLGLRADSVVVSEGPRIVVAVSSPDSGTLIGPQGEHLQAFNTIMRRVVEKKHGDEAANFLIDINRFHEERLKKLSDNALLLAQRARLFKHDVELEPMNSYERLVIHELFANDSEINTVSEGEGKTRRIVLKYNVTVGQ